MIKIKTGLFPVTVGLIYFPLLLVVLTLLFYLDEKSSITAVTYGSLISLVLIGATVLVAERMLTRTTSIMLVFLFGGFLIRFIVIIGCGVVVFYWTDIRLLPFFLGLFGSYIILQILEIVHLQKRLLKRVTGTNEHLDKNNE